MTFILVEYVNMIVRVFQEKQSLPFPSNQHTNKSNGSTVLSAGDWGQLIKLSPSTSDQHG